MGVILSGNSLVLQQVERSSAGQYTCSATNTRGTQTSNPVTLDVMYPPECVLDRTTVLAVGRGERVNISCRVASNPPRATFHWRLNGSERTYTSRGEPLPRGHVSSHYAFEGASDKDYGMLHCWANNSVGVQEQPCMFQIIPAGPPSSPERCAVVNNTAENIEVQCERGFDGGMRQLFLAEVFAEGGSLHLNRTSGDPVFFVDSLRPGTAYNIRVTAFNDKGRWRKNISGHPPSSPPTSGTAKSPPEGEENEGKVKEENGKQGGGGGKKKKVVVVENGMKDRVGHVISDVSTSKDALLGPESLTLANGCVGHYSSLGRGAPPSNTLPRPPLPSTTPSHTRPLPSTTQHPAPLHTHTLTPPHSLSSSVSHNDFMQFTSSVPLHVTKAQSGSERVPFSSQQVLRDTPKKPREGKQGPR
ncbi:hypothetical protein O3P69_011299 [Scylla paramamosain]|uniref:Nephrin n=1 Tax=Scylla paramamosain TaxID=85552 RepID=A0AAW0SHJ1_SCYPA